MWGGIAARIHARTSSRKACCSGENERSIAARRRPHGAPREERAAESQHVGHRPSRENTKWIPRRHVKCPAPGLFAAGRCCADMSKSSAITVLGLVACSLLG